MYLQFNAEFIADMLSWVTVNGLEAFDVQPYLVGGDQAPLKSDTRKATMTAPPSTDTELERVQSLVYSKDGKSGIDIWMDVTDFNSLPMGIYPSPSRTTRQSCSAGLSQTPSSKSSCTGWSR